MDRVSSYIRYPHGAGGMWLSHVVWCLENQQFFIDTAVPINFHQHQVTDSFEFGHTVNSDQDLVFGGPYGFRYYLNFWRKHRVANNYLNFNQMSSYQQFCELSNEALWIQSDTDWARMYAVSVNIDFANIWTDPDQFVDQLFLTLDKLGIKYIHNAEFVRSMITHYRGTCVPVEQFLGNTQQLPWLAWCHGLALSTHQSIPFEITEACNWQTLGELFSDPIYIKRTLLHTVGD